VGWASLHFFLHGAWNDSGQWVSVIDSLSDNFHFLVPDLLEFGESENPDFHHSIDLQAEWISEFIKALRLKKVYLLGYSLGAWIAASYALKYPDEVSGLVLLAPEGVGTEGEKRYWRKMQKIMRITRIISQIFQIFAPLCKITSLKDKIDKHFNLRRQLLENSAACQLLFQRQQ
jgi:haloalkane dehalogenase